MGVLSEHFEALARGSEIVEGDVTQSGLTVYMGGFDWITYQTPQVLLQKFPEFLPLPQQVFSAGDVEEPIL